jgi:hypothetical protein
MRCFLISSLVFKFSNAEASTFEKLHPHAWLLWEAGDWRPPAMSTIMATRPQVSLQDQEKAGEALALPLEPLPGLHSVTLGRAQSCDLPLNEGTLSQIHLCFYQDGPEWEVVDPGSKNGSAVGGQPLVKGQRVGLSNGVLIQAAQLTFTFYTPAGMLARLKAG